MISSTGLALFMGFWASVYLIDVFLKGHQSLSDSYLRFLGRTGLSVSVAQVRWYTTCFNRTFVRLGQWRPRFLHLWFTCGVYFGFVAMLFSVCILSLLVVNTIQQQPVEQQVLTPVMPGVNLPMGQVGYYLLTLLICGVLHEVGHAIAAIREQVRVNGFGLFVFALYPGAYVDLCSEHLQMITPMRQLRIYCAGVWHNFVIAVIALVVLFSMPWVLLPFYQLGAGVAIMDVQEHSAVSGPRGLAVRDQVTYINDCRITSLSDWSRCIHRSMTEPPAGFCMPLDMLRSHDISPYAFTTAMGNTECCLNSTSTHLCFSYYEKASPIKKHACLPARSTTERQSCKLPSDCYVPNMATTCVIPSLDNSTKLLRVFHVGKRPLLFLGYPLDLHYAVHLTDYVPKTLLAPVKLPYITETLCKYLISLSGALAILNVVPCYALDGQFILQGFLELGLGSSQLQGAPRGLLYTALMMMGTALLAINVLIAMVTLIR